MKNIPLLFNSFLKRKPFIDVCFFFYKKYFPNIQIYLTLDNSYDIKESNINILTYENIPSTSDLMYECHSRYYRHYYTLHYLKSLNFKYVVNCMDDGWIQNINKSDLDLSINYIEQHSADRIDLCGPQPEYKCLGIDEKVSLINSNNSLPWYLTNQCSIWRVETLLNIYEELGPVADWQVEKIGSDISRNNNYKFLTFNNPVIDNIGCFQRTVGLSEDGKRLLKEYCSFNNLNYSEELNKFNQFI